MPDWKLYPYQVTRVAEIAFSHVPRGWNNLFKDSNRFGVWLNAGLSNVLPKILPAEKYSGWKLHKLFV